jgi:hypothetical protein
MENQSNLQLELFSKTEDAGNLKSKKASNAFLVYIWNYEKTILVIISFIITGIISFSLGVEKGKRLSTLKNSRLDMALTTQPSDRPMPKNKNPNSVITKENTVKEPQPSQKQDYIIQLASYKTKAYAQKEMEFLKKRGFSPSVLSKGNYAVLCVGFSTRETAQSLLSELKKRYKDCYLRRL